MKNNIVIKTIEHKGVKVTIKTDYDKGEVSLLENAMGGYAKKKWCFAERGLEYMNGWLNVIDAMRHAVEIGIEDLEQKLAEDSAFKEEIFIKAVKAINKESKKK